MKAVLHDSLKLSDKVTIRLGDQFRVTGGGPMHGGKRVGVGIGIYEFRHAIAKGDRWYIEAVEITVIGKGRTFNIFVLGKPYRSRQCPGLVNMPHRIKPVAHPARPVRTSAKVSR